LLAPIDRVPPKAIFGGRIEEIMRAYFLAGDGFGAELARNSK
jgi:hypothetical protein